MARGGSRPSSRGRRRAGAGPPDPARHVRRRARPFRDLADGLRPSAARGRWCPNQFWRSRSRRRAVLQRAARCRAGRASAPSISTRRSGDVASRLAIAAPRAATAPARSRRSASASAAPRVSRRRAHRHRCGASRSTRSASPRHVGEAGRIACPVQLHYGLADALGAAARDRCGGRRRRRASQRSSSTSIPAPAIPSSIRCGRPMTRRVGARGRAHRRRCWRGSPDGGSHGQGGRFSDRGGADAALRRAALVPLVDWFDGTEMMASLRAPRACARH